MRYNGHKVSLLKVTLKNIPGALAKITTLLAEQNILSSIIDAPIDKPKALNDSLHRLKQNKNTLSTLSPSKDSKNSIALL